MEVVRRSNEMPFPTVKSSGYPDSPRRKDVHIWTEFYWKQLVLQSLLEIEYPPMRVAISKVISFRFSMSQLFPTDEV